MLVLRSMIYRLHFTRRPFGFGFCLEFCHDFCHTFCIGPGPLAQSVEQQTFNLWVVGSIPTGPTFNLYYSTSCLTYRVRLMLDRCSADP